MADRFLIRDIATPQGYVNASYMVLVFFSVHVPENFQKKVAHNESLRKLKTAAVENLVKV